VFCFDNFPLTRGAKLPPFKFPKTVTPIPPIFSRFNLHAPKSFLVKLKILKIILFLMEKVGKP
jgi:hypothetical protein